MGKERDIRILLVGDAGVGKTSLLLALVSEEFVQEVPGRTEEVTIPAEVTPEGVPTHITDYCSREQSDEDLAEEVRRAHVICIVYAAREPESVCRVSRFWLPRLREILGGGGTTAKPVILVGNKTDLLPPQRERLEYPMASVMEEFGEVETCLECSAKTMRNISAVFYYAQKAVLNPIGPLYRSETGSLTSECKEALLRVFAISDLDNDGVLSDQEMDAFQRRCFETPMQSRSSREIKDVVQDHVLDGVRDDGVTGEGFLFLNALFVQRGHHETVWKILRRFGYGEDLKLRKDYLSPQLRVPPGSTTELSPKGYRFLKALFKKYDRDADRCLSPEEARDMFAGCPCVPWGKDLPNTVKTNLDGWITLEGFLAYWTLVSLTAVHRTMEYLAYLGYVTDPEEDSAVSGVRVTRERNASPGNARGGGHHLQTDDRNVYRCRVISARDAGKTSFAQTLLDRPLDRQREYVYKYPGSEHVAGVVEVCGQLRYLALREAAGMEAIHQDPSTIEAVGGARVDRECDVVCLLYDSSQPRSFSHVAGIFRKHFAGARRSLLPVLFVATKADKPPAVQSYPLQPESFCAYHRLHPPVAFTARGPVRKEVFRKLAILAALPLGQRPSHRPIIPLASQMRAWLVAGASISVISFVSLLLVRLVHSTHSRFPLVTYVFSNVFGELATVEKDPVLSVAFETIK